MFEREGGGEGQRGGEREREGREKGEFVTYRTKLHMCQVYNLSFKYFSFRADKT